MQIKTFPKTYCTKHLHDKSEIIMVCMDKQCLNNRLCCLYCVDEEHTKHDLISFRKFQELMFEKLQNLNQNSDKKYILQLLETSEKQLLNKLKNLENLVLQAINKVQNELFKKFIEMYLLFRIPKHQDMIQELQKKFQVNTFEKILSYFDVTDKHQFGTFQDTNLVFTHQIQAFNVKIKQLQQNTTKNILGLKQIVEKMNYSSKNSGQPLQFDAGSKSGDISICDTNDIAIKQKGGGNRTLVLAKQPLSPINRKCSFKIIKNGDGMPSICLGVAIKSVVRTFNYSISSGYQKGIYALDQASNSSWGSLQESEYVTSWNHKHQNHCNVALDFQLYEDDIINVQLDYDAQTILFETQNDLFEMPIDLSVRDLYPFVGMVQKNATVQIMQTPQLQSLSEDEQF